MRNVDGVEDKKRREWQTFFPFIWPSNRIYSPSSPVPFSERNAIAASGRSRPPLVWTCRVQTVGEGRHEWWRNGRQQVSAIHQSVSRWTKGQAVWLLFGGLSGRRALKSAMCMKDRFHSYGNADIVFPIGCSGRMVTRRGHNVVKRRQLWFDIHLIWVTATDLSLFFYTEQELQIWSPITHIEITFLFKWYIKSQCERGNDLRPF